MVYQLVMLLATGNSKLNQCWFKKLECLLLIPGSLKGGRSGLSLETQ